MSEIITGIVYGLIASLMLGQVFIITIAESINKGRLNGFLFAFGAFLVDILYISMLYVGFLKIDIINDNIKTVGSISAFFLLLFGLKYIYDFTYRKISIGNISNDSVNIEYKSFGKGIFINLFNPFPVITWFAFIGSLVSSKLDVRIVVFFMSITVVLMDIVKVFAADRLSKWISPIHLRLVFLFCGLALTVISCIMLYRVWFTTVL